MALILGLQKMGFKCVLEKRTMVSLIQLPSVFLTPPKFLQSWTEGNKSLRASHCVCLGSSGPGGSLPNTIVPFLSDCLGIQSETQPNAQVPSHSLFAKNRVVLNNQFSLFPSSYFSLAEHIIYDCPSGIYFFPWSPICCGRRVPE